MEGKEVFVYKLGYRDVLAFFRVIDCIFVRWY